MPLRVLEPYERDIRKLGGNLAKSMLSDDVEPIVLQYWRFLNEAIGLIRTSCNSIMSSEEQDVFSAFAGKVKSD